jgi:hypothetical protein
MVDEKTATRTLTGRRQLHQTMPPLTVTYDPGLALWQSPDDESKAWIPIPGAFSAWYIEDYFDTSGYNRDYLTTMPLAAFNQEAGRLGITNPGTCRMIVLDIISEKRIDDLAGLNISFNANSGFIPSFSQSSDDWSQVLFGRYREFTGLTQGVDVQDVFTPVRDNQFGSLDPTTNDKLWIYKIVSVLGVPLGALQSTLRFPNSRTVLQIDVVKEDDLEFLMRQKRSYELTNY